MKQPEPQDPQALYRVRERLMKARTALVHELRGLLHAYGIVLPQGITTFRPLLVSKRQKEQATLRALSTEVFWPLYDEYLSLEKRSRLMMSSWRPSVEPIPHVNGCRPCLGLDPSVPPPSWRPSALRPGSRTAASFRPGSGWSPGNTRREARHGASGSAHAATAICAHDSCTAPEPRPAGSIRSRTIGVGGSQRASPDAATTARPSTEPIRTPAWLGRSSRTTKSTASRPS
jgi:hypothetical protein